MRRFHESILIVAALMAMSAAGAAEEPGANPAAAMDLFATVFLVRGSVVGSQTGQFGPFRHEQDTLWKRLSLSNVFAFRFARFAGGPAARLYLAAGNGVHRSTDDGATWRLLTGWEMMEVLSVLPDRADSALIYAATPWGIFRSTDDGATWHKQMHGMRRWFVGDIVHDLRTPGSLLAIAEDDIYQSVDRAEHWTSMGLRRGQVLAMLQHPRNHDLFLAAVEDSGLFRSSDGGKHWNRVRGGLEGKSVYTIVASSDGRELYAAGWDTGVWRSSDDGASWTSLWHPPDIAAIFALLVDPLNSDHLFAGTDGAGLYESPDHGAHWRWAGMRGGQVKHIVMYPHDSGKR